MHDATPLPDLAGRVRLLRRLPWAARLEAVRAGLLVADPVESGPLAIELIEMAVLPTGGLFLERRRRKATEALEALVGLWHRIPDAVRPLARSVGRGRWAAAVDAVLRHPDDADEARSAALLAADLGDPEMAGALDAALRLNDDRAQAAAEMALLSLSLRARGVPGASVAPEIEGADLRALDGPRIEGIERAALDVRLADAAWGFASHQRRLVLLAAIAALDLRTLCDARSDRSGAGGGARLMRLIQEPSHVGHRALRQMLRWSPAPLVRERALLLLAEPSIAEAALERLSRAESTSEHAAVLDLAHLALRPARRRHLSSARVFAPGAAHQGAQAVRGQFLPEPRAWDEFGTEARRGAVCLLALVDADDAARSGVLHHALSDPDPCVRLRALALLPRADLASYCFDPDPHVARSAMLRWSTAGLGLRARAEPGERARVVTLLTRSPHASVRALAAQDAARETVWNPSHPASRAGAWRLALRERDALLARLRTTIQAGAGAPDAPPREPTGTPSAPSYAVAAAIDAIGIARSLGLVRVLEADLADLLDPDRGARGGGVAPHLAATAATALGDLDDVLSRESLRRGLNHPDPRVRANAVEAIGAQRLSVEDATTGRDRDYSVLVELKGDEHHRVRANAIRALLLSPPACPKDRKPARRGQSLLEEKPRIFEPAAVEALARMLADQRQAHRLAGAWLAGRVLADGRSRVGPAWTGLCSRLAELSGSDPDPAVRARARHASARLSAGLRASWGRGGRPGQADGMGVLIGTMRGDATPEEAAENLGTTIAGAPVEPAGTRG